MSCKCFSKSFEKNKHFRCFFFFKVPVDCSWNPWTEWTPCSVSCGIGQRLRDRSFIQSVNGGMDCNSAESNEEEFCNTEPCTSKLS